MCPVHHLWSQALSSVQYCLYRSKSLYCPLLLPYTAASSKSSLCLNLVQGT
jgi:hypothetical protein